MRGIAGILHLDQRPVRFEEIARLVRQVSSGAFDQATHACAGPVGLGHLLRYGAPEDRFEAQPLWSTDRSLFLVTDASLENRSELAGHFGWSRAEADRLPDSAFVLAAYQKWGEASPAHLDGKWAFAVWHARERQLFAAVDHFSFRPFYYVSKGAFFAFSTTLRGLLSLPGVSREIHDGVLADCLLTTRSHPGHTLYRDIKSLPAAHHLRVSASNVVIERYWRADPRRELKLGSDADYVAAFRGEFERTVAASLRVEGNIGILVSGGLDSAAVTAVAGRLLAAQGRRLQAIHRLPPDGGPRRHPGREIDESRYVRRMQADMPHIDFHFMPPPPADARVSFENWDAMLDNDWAPIFGVPLEKSVASDGPLRRPQVGRMLTGHGGNYTVSLEAYPSDYFLQLATRLQWGRLWRELHGHARFYHRTVRHLVKYRILQPLFPAREEAGDNRMGLLNFLNPEFIRQTDMRERLRRPRFRRWARADFSVKLRLAWILNELMPQTMGVRGSVIGVNARSDSHAPLMARRLNELCLSMPVAQQIRDGRDRLLLRHAMRGLLPDEVIWRTSRGFNAPDSWYVARQLVAALPAALDDLGRSSLVARYVDLGEFRRRFVNIGEGELRGIGTTRLIQLFNVAWFLRWLEKRGQ